jgi:hypothetical protein
VSYLYEPNYYGYINNQSNTPTLVPLSHPCTTASVASTSNLRTNIANFSIGLKQKVNINYSFISYNYPYSEDCEVSISDNYNNTVFYKSGLDLNSSDTLTLSAGTYILSAKAPSYGFSASISVTSTIYESDAQGNFIFNKDLLTGGFRIKKLVQYDGSDHNKDKISTYSYAMPNEPDRSSGVIMNSPSHEYTIKQAEISYISWLGIPTSGTFCLYDARTGSSNQPIYGKDGHIGYRFVRETMGRSGENGSTLYNFTTSFEYSDIIIPKSVNITKDYMRALETKIIKFDSTGKTLYSKENIYNNPITSPNRNGIAGVFLVEYEENNAQDYLDKFKNPYFGIIESNWLYLSELIETYYFNAGDIVTKTKYFYENPIHAQLTKTIEQSSDINKTIETKFFYPSDNPTNIHTNTSILDLLIEKNMQVKLKVEKSIENSVVEGQNINYGLNLLPSNIYMLENGVYNPKIYFDSYDGYGNITQLHKEYDALSFYRWGYNSTYLIAETQNATISECGYTGFENNESNSFPIPGYATTAYVTDAYTGHKALQVSSLYGPGTSFTVGDNAQIHSGYKASVWVKGAPEAYLHIQVDGQWGTNARATNSETGTGWHHLEVELPRIKIQPYFSSNLKVGVYVGTNGGAAIFDDLRFYPMDAQMTTYTYDPLIGVTSVSDVNNKPTIYKYDAFNRLWYIKDFQGNILKKYDYHYKQP